MSFSSDVKLELCQCFSKNLHCSIAELSAIINLSGKIVYYGDVFWLKIQTEDFLFVKKCFTILENTFNIRAEVKIRVFKNGRKNRNYIIVIHNKDDVVKLLKGTSVGIFENGRWKLNDKIDPVVINSNCCRRSYIRGVFLCSGSITDPMKNYHLEFVFSSKNFAQKMQNLINTFELDSKLIERKEYFVVYIKEGEKIVDLLNVIEAHKALMELENIRIMKEVRNDINRKVNCETANISKVINASVKQINDITYIDKVMGIKNLPENLQEIAEIRIQYPHTSLKELGTYLKKPVGKSGVNHRLKKLSILAETLREDNGELI